MVSVSNLVIRAGNQAPKVNPTNATTDIKLTTHGSDWLWAVFTVFLLFAIIHGFIYGTTSSKKHGLKKTLFIIPLFTNAVLGYTYFTYASNLGWTSTPVLYHHITTSSGFNNRQVFYVKYIGWFLAWPFVLYAIEVATHTIEVNEANTSGGLLHEFITLLQGLVVKVLSTEVFVLGLLIGALINSTYRWGYFTFAVSAQLFAMSLILIQLIRSMRSLKERSLRMTNKNMIAHFIIAFELFVWLCYPIAWGLSEGGNRIQPDSEAVFYGILDLITFCFVPSFLTWINALTLDEDFFKKVFNIGYTSAPAEKHIGETPRHSGDTAVPTTHTENRVEGQPENRIENQIEAEAERHAELEHERHAELEHERQTEPV